MIIAIFGFSCTGKTTLGRHLRDVLGLPFRSCGEAVMDRARILDTPWQELSYDEHRRVDADTREWVRKNRPCLVEGRYLHCVLAPLGREVILVRLEASDEDRRRREEAKNGLPLTAETFEEQEKADLAFSDHMYSIGRRVTPSLVLDSSELSVEACVQRIKYFIESFRARRG